MKKLALLAMSLVPLALAATPAPADACGGAIFQERFIAPKPTPPQLVAKGEKQLEEGSAQLALRQAKEAYTDLHKSTAGKDAIKNRALRLAAIATVRSGGELSVAPAQTASSKDAWGDTVTRAKPIDQSTSAKQERLEWAIGTLRALSTNSPDNPSVEADLGEALSSVAGHEGEAFERLSKLADKDLLGSPTAYAVLARLRAQQGLTKKSIEAVQRCREMTRTPAVCGPDVGSQNPA